MYQDACTTLLNTVFSNCGSGRVINMTNVRIRLCRPYPPVVDAAMYDTCDCTGRCAICDLKPTMGTLAGLYTPG